MLEASGNEFLVKAATDLWNSFPKFLIWNIGSTPVREALLHLQSMGLAIHAAHLSGKDAQAPDEAKPSASNHSRNNP